jgi:glycosyltransferase involved in cell wall biosynthesis
VGGGGAAAADRVSESGAVPISVVLPTWNRAHLVHKAIDSVLAQTYSDFELIVVDDGSTDETPAALARYGDRIRVVRRENGGLSRARNSGIEAARHEWIAFLDDDDEWEAGMLAAHAAAVRAHPHVVAHATNTCVISAKGERTNLFALRGFTETARAGIVERPLVWILRGCFFTQAVMVRRQALRDVGLYDPSMIYEDVDLFSKLAPAGPWAVTDRELLRLYTRPDGEYSLSANIRNKPVKDHSCMVAILDRAARDPHLHAAERKAVRRMLSRQRFSLGEAYLGVGEPRLARRSFVRSMADCLGPTSFAKAVLPATFGAAGLRMWRAIEPVRATTTRGSETAG